MGRMAVSSGTKCLVTVPKVVFLKELAMPVAAFLIAEHVDAPTTFLFTVGEALHVQVVGTAETAAETMAHALAWLAADEGYRELPLLDVFRQEGTGFRVMTHTTRHRSSAA